ncbi:MAG: hypothetical protein U0175_37640 [Caldilineaceae bacterium]
MANGFRQLNMLVSNAGVLRYDCRGDFIDARSNFFLHSLEVSQALGDRYGDYWHTNLWCTFRRARVAQNRPWSSLSQALKLFREIGSQRMEADLLVNLALTPITLGRSRVQSVDYTNQALGQVDQNFQHIITPAYLNLVC